MLNISRMTGFSEKRLVVAFLILTAAIVVDWVLGTIADLVIDFAISIWGVVLFTILASIYILGQYYVFTLVKSKNSETVSKKTHFKGLERVVSVTQHILAALIFITVIEVIFLSQYQTSILGASTVISYGLVVYLMIVLAIRFFAWYRIYKSFAVLLYGLAAVMIAINAADSIIFNDVILTHKTEWITPQSEVIFETNFETDNPMFAVSTLQALSLNAYFLLTWGGTVMILYHNIRRVGQARFWLLMSPPIVFFMSFYISFYETINPTTPSETPLVPILLVNFSIIAAAILFGGAFFSIAKSIDKSSPVRGYLTVTGCAFILFYVAAAAAVLQAGYPPFGLLALSYVGPAAFLLFSGLYRSAISVAEDVKVRKTISRSAESLQFVQGIGKAEMQLELEKKIMGTVRVDLEKITEYSGIEPSLTVEEIQSIVEDAANQLRRKKIGDTETQSSSNS